MKEVDGLNEVSSKVSTDDEGRGAKRGIADEETDVLESPLTPPPSDEVRIVFLALSEAPLASLPRGD